MRALTIDRVGKRAEDWLFRTAAPFWAEKGVHPDGMFVEAFTRDGDVIDVRRRLRVQARQIFCFCELGRLGWTGPWRTIVENALQHLLDKGMTADGRFVHQFDHTATVVDERPDLYDQAFGLFALAHAGRALERSDLFDRALRLLDLLDERWARVEGGYWEGELTLCPPYRQNPHMHVFEAALALHAFSGNPRWLGLATRLAVLFKGRFQNRECGAVTEYFDVDWRPVEGRDGMIVEPGHCFEWAWLFEVAPPGVRDVATAEELSSFARENGICAKRNLAINEVLIDGVTVVDHRARLWPQTERLKSAVARHARTGSNEDANDIVSAYSGLEKYFTGCKPGLWCDKIDIDGKQIDEPAPASSFYHIVCALSVLLQARYTEKAHQ